MNDEIRLRTEAAVKRLKSFISRNKRPDWFSLFGLYPAKESVNAAEVTLGCYVGVGSEEYKRAQKKTNIKLTQSLLLAAKRIDDASAKTDN